MKDIFDILETVGQDRRACGKLALATLVRVEGSSYRRPGARMLIYGDGRIIGSLSAGCLEDDVIARAGEVLETGEPALMSFDTRRRFGCAGKIDIFIERVNEKFFSDVSYCLDARKTCLATTVFDGSDTGSRVVADDYEPDPEHEFLQEFHPPIRLLIFGDGPDNVPFWSLGGFLGWEMNAVVDSARVVFEPDHWTAALVKSHNYGRDFAALEKLLPMNLRYVGLIGPRKRRDQLMNDLLERGISINAGFFAPAGLDLGAETPEEIALAIVSEIQRVFGTGSGVSLRERKTAIHPSINAPFA